jgi:hypothetical protein
VKSDAADSERETGSSYALAPLILTLPQLGEFEGELLRDAVLPPSPNLLLTQRALQEAATWRWKARRLQAEPPPLEFVVNLPKLLHEKRLELQEAYAESAAGNEDYLSNIALSGVGYRSTKQLRMELSYLEQFAAYLENAPVQDALRRRYTAKNRASFGAVRTPMEELSVGAEPLQLILPMNHRELVLLLRRSAPKLQHVPSIFARTRSRSLIR